MEKAGLKEKSPSAANRGAGNMTTDISIQDQRAKFLREIFADLPGYIEIREIKQGQSNQIFFEGVEELNQYDPPQDKNIYIGMMTRQRKSGKKKDVKQTQVLWLDFDDVDDLMEIDYILDMKGLPRYSMAVKSGHGFHIYWLLDKPAGREIAPVLRELTRRAGADMKAAETARIMRLPGTMNVKSDPVKCGLVDYRGDRYKLQDIAELLGVEPQADRQPKQADKAIGIDYEGVMSKIDRTCIKSMLEGVKEGRRNWILGRLTMYFREIAGYPKDKTRKIIKAWNFRNQPPQKEKELMKSFNTYWHNDYNLLGCKILDKDKQPVRKLQQILNKHCNKDSCSRSGNYQTVNGGKYSKYNNRIIKRIKKLSGTALVIYGVLEKHPEGLTAERITEIIDISEKTFRDRVEELINIGFVNKKSGIKRRGIPDLFYIKRQGTYGTGRTAVNYGAVLLAANKVITPAQYKVYVLLNWFKHIGQNGRTNPSTFTIAEKLGCSRSTIQNHVSALEKKDIIEIDRRKGQSNEYHLKLNLEG